MTLPDPSLLLAAMEATWPPGEAVTDGVWTLRRGAGGGKRVSAASPAAEAEAGGVADAAAIAAAEARMTAWQQTPLFRIVPGEEALDAALAARGYRVIDPVAFYAAPVERLLDGADETARVIRVSTRLALAEEIWDAGGIGPGRRAVMARAAEPKVTLLARLGDRPAGVAFVALDGGVAMLHAVEVPAEQRRRGAGAMLGRGAASFAADHGARWLALAVTEANGPARALYETLGMARTGGYHYRILSD